MRSEVTLHSRMLASFQMGGLTSLRRLWLSNNRIHDIPASSGAWKSLEQVNLSRNLIRHLPDEVQRASELHW